MTLYQWDQAVTLFFNGSDSSYLDGIVWSLTQSSTWIFFLGVLLFSLYKSFSVRHLLLILLAVGICIFVTDRVSSGLIKPWVARYRPTHDPMIAHLVDVVRNYRGGKYGFFSSHAANTFALSTFITLLLRDRVVSCTLFTWALLNCWTRLYLGVHFMGDILVGICFGMIVAWMIYRCFRNYHWLPLQPAQRKHTEVLLAFLITLIGVCIP